MARTLFACVYLLFASLTAVPALAVPSSELIAQANRAIDNGDLETAFELYKQAADKNGNAIAINDLGVMYLNGMGVTQSDFTGYRYIHKAAKRGYPPAQRNLGILLSQGVWVKRNPAKAKEWLQLAANNGDADAQALLGRNASALNAELGLSGYKASNETPSENDTKSQLSGSGASSDTSVEPEPEIDIEAELSRYQSSNEIKLLGITAAMPSVLQKHVLRQRGYSCTTQRSLTNIFGGLSCSKGSANVNLRDGVMTFNCHNFNACNLSLREYAQALIDQGVVRTLNYEADFNRQSGWNEWTQSFAGNLYADQAYCGNGPGGDRLCLMKTGNPQLQMQLLFGGVQLIVERGSGAVTFN